MLFSRISLREYTQLHLLYIDLLGLSRLEAPPGLEIRWFETLCRTTTSQFLKIQLIGSPSVSETCLDIEDTLLTLSQMNRGLWVYLDKGQKDIERHAIPSVVSGEHHDGILGGLALDRG